VCRTTLVGVAVGTLIVATLPWVGMRASANHPKPLADGSHLFYMHYASSGQGSFDEDYCADSFDANLSDASYLDMIRKTLVVDSPHWDGTANWKIDLWNVANPCFSYSDRNWIEIEWRNAHSSKPAWCGGYSCVALVGPVPSQSDIDHYQWANVYTETAHINGGPSEYHQLISHEFGHVVGLKDPNYFGDCASVSIMHTFSTAYGCPYREFPYQIDKDTVTSIADNVNHGFYD
jgi:hypothetical protein